MFKKTVFVLMICLSLAVFGSGCQSQTSKSANSLLSLLNSSGTTYTLVKADTNVKGYSVFENMATGQFIAYNVSKFNSTTMTTLSQYLAALGTGDVVTGLSQNTYSQWVDGYWVNDGYYDNNGYWVDTSYWVSGYTDTWTNYENANYSFENQRTSSKDLESFVSNAAKADTNAVQASLVAQYGFSTDRAAAVATLTKQMKEISGTRELTDSDKTMFTQQSLGVDYATLNSALKQSDQGNAANFNRLVSQAAAKNGTTPEQTRQLILDVSTTENQ